VQRARTALPGARVDVMHGTNLVPPRAWRAARVVTVPDLAPLRFPELHTRETRLHLRLVRRAIARGAWVHTLSAFVTQEVVSLLGADPARVVTVSPGIPPLAAGNPTAGRRMAGADRYILALGTIEPRKDHAALVRAFDRLAAHRGDVNLVVAGADGWAVDTFGEEVRRARHGDRVVRLGYLDEAGRSALLRGASVFALPSRYEGFGFTPLEAMEAGVPVIATAVGSLPEVLGEAAVLVPPGDDEALSEGLARLLDDAALQTQLMKAGRNRLSRHSWKACAEGLAALYHRAVAER
jgi:alpha-1,3-rhamnosyl/mannosyltransferase